MEMPTEERPSLGAAVNNEWEQIKQENRNAQVSSSSSMATDIKVPYEQDGSVQFFFVDAHEENTSSGPVLMLFGKVWSPEVNQFVSCSLQVKGMQRVFYVLPKKAEGGVQETLSEAEEKKQFFSVYQELEEIRK